jgi:hypothetical protein
VDVPSTGELPVAPKKTAKKAKKGDKSAKETKGKRPGAGPAGLEKR